MTPARAHFSTFSARLFFHELLKGSSQNSTDRPNFDIPSSGLHIIRGSSLDWIDGLFAESYRIEKFLSAIKQGALPEPHISESVQSYRNHFTYCSPEILARSQNSILSVFQDSLELIEQAAVSSVVGCPLCGTTMDRFPSPLALVNTLRKDWEGQSVSLSASSADDSLERWAEDFGFQTVTDTHPSFYSVRLDAFTSSEDSLARISQLLKSLWRIPGIILTCASDSHMKSYTPAGWCSACGITGPTISKNDIRSIISRGIERTDSTLLRASGLGSLVIAPSVTIYELAQGRIEDLTTPPSSVLHQICQTLVSVGLGQQHLLSPIATLSSRGIAALSIAVSLYHSARTRSVILIDLPSGIFSVRTEARIHEQMMRAAHTMCLICLNDPFASTARHISSSSFEKPPEITPLSRPSFSLSFGEAHEANLTVSPGQVLAVALDGYGIPQRLMSDPLSFKVIDAHANVTHSLSGSTIAPAVYPIPIFPERPSVTHVFGDKLRCMEKLAQLYAASVAARSAGLSPKDFLMSSPRTNSHLCSICKGLGVCLEFSDVVPRPRAQACPICAGLRFTAEVSSILFKGIAYQEILSRPLKESATTLAALSRIKEATEVAEALNLSHLPLGMPIALLSSSELRRVLILEAVLASRPTKPSVVILERPDVGFSSEDRDAIIKLQNSPFLSESCMWVELVNHPHCRLPVMAGLSQVDSD